MTLLLLTLVLLALAGAGGFALLLVRDRTYVASPPYAPAGTPRAGVAVVYYSRSGHSEAVAREIARAFNAPIARIDADYPRDWAGLRKAGADAKAQALPEIRVDPSAFPGGLGPVRRLFLVSPTWWFRPATPLWSYVERTDLTGKEIILVTTGNSRFEQSETDAFARRVEARGGRLASHIFLRRGRILWQRTREELLEEVRGRIAAMR